MSRLARKPLLIPDGVKVNLEEGKITVEGKLGKLEEKFVHNFVDVKSDGKQIVFSSKGLESLSKMYQGLYFRIFQNMIFGVTEGFSKVLAIQGLGYKWEIKGKELILMVGYSKPVKYTIPEGITMKIDSSNSLVISGCSKQKVGQVAAEIRSVRPPEPYKGKGIRYLNERIRLKEGKAAK